MPHFRCIVAILWGVVFLGSAGADEKLQPVDDTFKIFPDPAGRAYFPKGQESFYTQYLAAMKEPSLMPRPKSVDTFALRFTWLRSFHDPIAIRIWRDGKDYRIKAVRLAKQPDCSPGPKTKDTTRKLTKDELLEIQRLAGIKSFWNPLNDQEEEIFMGANDGARWIFEQLNQKDYSIIDVWSPNVFKQEQCKQLGVDATKIRDFKVYAHLGLYLLKITTLVPTEQDIY